MPNAYRTELTLTASRKINELLLTMPGFARRYFDHLEARNSSILTQRQYAYDMSQFFAYAAQIEQFKALPPSEFKSLSPSDILDQISVDDLHDYVRSLRYYEKEHSSGMRSATTVARKLSSLRSFYAYYQKLGEIQTNPAIVIEKPKVPDKEIDALDVDEIERLLQAVESDEGLTPQQRQSHDKTMLRDLAIIKLFLGTGIRVSELVGINMSDVDFTARSIRVTRKGGDEEPVYLNGAIIEAIQEYCECCRPDLLGTIITDNYALFISLHHKRMTTVAVENMVRTYAKRAGLSGKITPHSLRRSFGTYLYEETNDIYLVADALHHKSVETTQKHYAKMSKEHKRKASEISESLIK